MSEGWGTKQGTKQRGEHESLEKFLLVLLHDETTADAAKEVHVSTQRAPERQLFVAILNDAVQAIRENNQATRDKKTSYREAVEWFKSTSTDWTFSFENVCIVLDLPAEAIRKEMLK